MNTKNEADGSVLFSLGLLLGGGAPEEVEVDLEPPVDVGVDGVIFVADLLRRQTLLTSLVLRRRPVLIRTADEQQVPVAQTAVSAKTRHDACIQHLYTFTL